MASSQPLTETGSPQRRARQRTSFGPESEILKCAEGQTPAAQQIKEIASETDTILNWLQEWIFIHLFESTDCNAIS